jgi:hypothetical protein
MSTEPSRPFESIESAHEFIALLEESIQAAMADVTGHIQDANARPDPRRSEALTLASFKMNQLSTHVRKSRRILNDLRTIRRLLFSERSMDAATSRET